MRDRNSNNFYLGIIEKIQSDLRIIDSLSSITEIRERIHELIDFIDKETLNNRAVFEEILHLKMKEAGSVNPQLNANLYILYRNLTQNKITLQEAKKLYRVYLKEFETN